MVESVEIRAGGAEDIPALLALIKELAVFEKAPEEVITNEAELLADWQKGAYEFLVLSLDGQVIGISLYYPRYSTWKGFCYYLEDLYIQEPYRGRGFGKQLLVATAERAKAKGAKRLDWQVLDWNQSAVQFYESLGAHIEKEWWNCKWWL